MEDGTGRGWARKAEDGGKEMGAAVPVFSTNHDVAKDHKAVKNMGVGSRKQRISGTRKGRCVSNRRTGRRVNTVTFLGPTLSWWGGAGFGPVP